jgi:hypothetical protein
MIPSRRRPRDRDRWPHGASGRFAFHVLDVLLSLEAATRADTWIQIESTVERPEALVD